MRVNKIKQVNKAFYLNSEEREKLRKILINLKDSMFYRMEAKVKEKPITNFELIIKIMDGVSKEDLDFSKKIKDDLNYDIIKRMLRDILLKDGVKLTHLFIGVSMELRIEGTINLTLWDEIRRFFL